MTAFKWITKAWPFIVVWCLLILALDSRRAPIPAPNPLGKSIYKRNMSEVHRLLESGFPPNRQVDYKDPLRGRTSPLRFACQSYINADLPNISKGSSVETDKVEKIIRDLVQHGAKLNQVQTDPLRPYMFGSPDFGSELAYAVAGNSPSLYKLLTELGADPKLPCRAGPTLFFCVPDEGMFVAERDPFEVLNELKKAGVDIDKRDWLGRTALHYAASIFEPKYTRCFIKLGANVNIKDDLGLSALDCARSKDSYDLLVAAGAKHGNKF
jgi:ankyrin repeat protein